MTEQRAIFVLGRVKQAIKMHATNPHIAMAEVTAILEEFSNELSPAISPACRTAGNDIRDLLIAGGFNTAHSGFVYAITAIEKLIENPGLARGQITKTLYPDVAKKHQTTASRVERAIRHAIEKAFDRSDRWDATFGRYFAGSATAPTNTEFLTACVDMLQNGQVAKAG